MDPSDSSQNRRKIPAVSDVVAELSKRLLATPEQQPMLFRAAQQVCAEELRLVRTGFRSAPFDELVERAIRLLPAELAREEASGAPESSAFPEPEPFDTAAAPARPGRAPEEGPFALDSRDAVESYEPPKPASGPVRPLEISEKVPPPASPKVAPYGGYLREPRKDRHSRSISATRVLIFLLLVGIGFGAYRIARTGYWPFRKSASPAPKKTPPAPAPMAPKTAPPVPAAAPAPLPAPPSPSRPPLTASVPKPPPSPGASASAPSAGIPESRGSSMISPDWKGHPPEYMIHFSSYQRRENAERDRARLSKAVGGTFHVVEVNLGREGSWFRVMLGDFGSREEALAFRQRLAERGTPEMGLVYKVSGTP